MTTLNVSPLAETRSCCCCCCCCAFVVVVGVASLSLKQCRVCVCERGGGGVHHLQQLLFYIHCKLPSYVSNYTACIHNSNCLFALLRSLFHSLSRSLLLILSQTHTHTHTCTSVARRLSLVAVAAASPFWSSASTSSSSAVAAASSFCASSGLVSTFQLRSFFYALFPSLHNQHTACLPLSMNVCVCVFVLNSIGLHRRRRRRRCLSP